VVKEIRADLLACVDEFSGLPLVVCRQLGVRLSTSAQAHATQGQAGYFQVGVGDFDHFHKSIFLSFEGYQE